VRFASSESAGTSLDLAGLMASAPTLSP
jgi:hypothetical protein